MPNNNYGQRLFATAVRLGEIVPEQDLETKLSATSQRLFHDATAVMNALLTGDYHGNLYQALLELIADCYLVSAVAGADMDTLLDSFVNRLELQRIPDTRAAPTAEQVMRGVSTTTPEANAALLARGIKGW